MRYVERNPVRAKSIPVLKAQNWPWSSVGKPPREFESVQLHLGPVKRHSDWLDGSMKPLSGSERNAMNTCLNRGRPFGRDTWTTRIVKKLGLESTVRPHSRPRKSNK